MLLLLSEKFYSSPPDKSPFMFTTKHFTEIFMSQKYFVIIDKTNEIELC